jgi:hypothetical protein
VAAVLKDDAGERARLRKQVDTMRKVLTAVWKYCEPDPHLIGVPLMGRIAKVLEADERETRKRTLGRKS